MVEKIKPLGCALFDWVLLWLGKCKET